MLKYYIKVIIRNLLKVFWIFPIDKKKIYFQAFGGKSMNCNPWYIFKYMYEKYPDYKYVWLLNHEPEERLKGVTYVKKNTFKWVKEILTSKVVITNDGFPGYLGYRKQQVLINTWHGGGAYKKVGNLFDCDFDFSKTLKFGSMHTSYFISSCEVFTNVMTKSNYIEINKYLPIGMPRNDVFFRDESIKVNCEKIRRKYNLAEYDFIVLYAPTYRGQISKATFESTIDTKILKEVLKKKYGKNVAIMFRGHYFLKNNLISNNFDKDVSDYPDMQELLCAADILITDYSSSMWDYSFLNRPCFLFTPDIDEYMENRGFYTDPYSWGFPICKTNEELIEAINNFDEKKFIAAMKKHHEDLGSYEVGNATGKIVNLIVNYNAS